MLAARGHWWLGTGRPAGGPFGGRQGDRIRRCTGGVPVGGKPHGDPPAPGVPSPPPSRSLSTVQFVLGDRFSPCWNDRSHLWFWTRSVVPDEIARFYEGRVECHAPSRWNAVMDDVFSSLTNLRAHLQQGCQVNTSGPQWTAVTAGLTRVRSVPNMKMYFRNAYNSVLWNHIFLYKIWCAGALWWFEVMLSADVLRWECALALEHAAGFFYYIYKNSLYKISFGGNVNQTNFLKEH